MVFKGIGFDFSCSLRLVPYPDSLPPALAIRITGLNY